MASDIIAQDCSITEKQLKHFRKIVEETQRNNSKIHDDAAVVIVALDGAAEHKFHHPNFGSFHYVEFAERCRSIMKKHGGLVLESSINDFVNYVAVGWFPNDGVKAIISIAEFRESLLEDIQKYQPPWMHERHHIAAIGRGEYSAAHLLQLAQCDSTVLDPTIHELLAHNNKDFCELAQESHFVLPNYERLLDEIDESIDSNVDYFRKLWERKQAKRNKKHRAALVSAGCS